MTSEFGVKRRVGKTISSTFGYAMFILSLPQPGEGFEKKNLFQKQTLPGPTSNILS